MPARLPTPCAALVLALLATLALTSTTAAAQPGPELRKTATCHSNDHEYQRCNVHGWRGVELVRQVSRAACVRGETWGVDGEWLWVSGGCRADFAEPRAAHLPFRDQNADFINMDDTESCHSNNSRFQRCQVGLWEDAALVRQDSRTPCIRGENWDLDGTAIWVSDGCRGVFAEVVHRPVRRQPPRDRGYPRDMPASREGWNRDIEFVCQSRDQRYKFCQVDVGVRGWVELTERESSASCEEGRSWGWNRAGIWVDRGCRARFRVHRRR